MQQQKSNAEKMWGDPFRPLTDWGIDRRTNQGNDAKANNCLVFRHCSRLCYPTRGL